MEYGYKGYGVHELVFELPNTGNRNQQMGH